MSFSKIIPALIAVAFLCDVSLRTLPAERFAFRGWEAVARYKYGFGPFEPNKHYSSDRTHGDLPNLGNIPKYRVYHPETFTTDECGFRNSRSLSGEIPFDAVTIGSSFTVSTGVSDTETLAAQLEQLSGLTVYNAGGLAPETTWIVPLLQRIKLGRGVVILEHLEGRRILLNLTENPDSSGADDPCDTSGWYKTRTAVKEVGKGFYNVSPLRIFTQRAFNGLRNDVLLPNDHSAILQRHLKNGKTMLFLAQEVRTLNNPTPAAQVLEQWKRFEEILAQRHLKLVVLQVPAKYTVYGPLLDTPAIPSPHDELAELHELATRAGLVSVNLKPILQAAAAEGLKNDQYLYFIDDSHWNAEGIRVAAKVIAETVAGLK